MKLATHWDESVALIEAQPDDRKAWSLDGALGLLRAAEKARQEAERGDAGEEFGADAEPAPKAKKETEAERLRRELAEAIERIKQLESVIMAMQGQAKQEAPKREAPKGPSGAAKVSPDTANKARKTYALFVRGGTQGERDAARVALERMASRHVMNFDEFVVACGLA